MPILTFCHHLKVYMPQYFETSIQLLRGDNFNIYFEILREPQAEKIVLPYFTCVCNLCTPRLGITHLYEF